MCFGRRLSSPEHNQRAPEHVVPCWHVPMETGRTRCALSCYRKPMLSAVCLYGMPAGAESYFVARQHVRSDSVSSAGPPWNVHRWHRDERCPDFFGRRAEHGARSIRGGVEGPLECGRVVGLAVAFRPKVQHIEAASRWLHWPAAAARRICTHCSWQRIAVMSTSRLELAAATGVNDGSGCQRAGACAAQRQGQRRKPSSGPAHPPHGA